MSYPYDRTTQFRVGDTIRAFHPRRFGVVNTGTIVKVGRVWLHVDFGELFGGTFKVAPHSVTDIIDTPAPSSAGVVAPDDDGVRYLVKRFHFRGDYETIKRGLTLAEAQAHCQRDDTHGFDEHGNGWFDGYDVDA